MKTFETTLLADADKQVRLTIPVEEANQSYHLVILVEPATDRTPSVRDWPPGFFENTAGKWVGELERPPQGEYEKREEL
jgi:hypothetical protein